MTPSANGSKTGAATDEDVVQTLHDVVRLGTMLAEAFHRRLPGSDGHGEAPFALRSLREAGRRGLPQVEFAKLLGSSATSATRMIDAMEAAGLMIRSPHPTDRRIKLVQLTPHGETVIDDLFGRLTACASDLRSWKSSDITQFRTQLDRCARSIDRSLTN